MTEFGGIGSRSSSCFCQITIGFQKVHGFTETADGYIAAGGSNDNRRRLFVEIDRAGRFNRSVTFAVAHSTDDTGILNSIEKTEDGFLLLGTAGIYSEHRSGWSILVDRDFTSLSLLNRQMRSRTSR